MQDSPSTNLLNESAIQKSQKKCLTNISEPPEWFTGREKLLDTLSKKLSCDGNCAIKQAVICGIGGIGKTELARKYGYDNYENYDIRWFINAETEVLIKKSFSELAKHLDIVVEEKESYVINKEVKRSLVERQKWLLIFDNVEDFGLIEEYIPVSGGHVLLTTRNEIIKESIKVEEFSLSETVLYLETSISRGVKDKLTDRDKEDIQIIAKQIVDDKSSFPLLLEQVTIFLKERGFEKYLEQYKKNPSKFLTNGLFTKNLNSLAKNSRSTVSFFKKCVFLAPEDKPEIFLKALANNEHLELMLINLKKYSLMTLYQDKYNVHRLIQRSVINEMKDKERQDHLRIVSQKLRETLPYDKFDTKTYSLAQAWLPHINVIMEECKKEGVKLDDILSVALDIVESMSWSSKIKDAAILLQNIEKNLGNGVSDEINGKGYYMKGWYFIFRSEYKNALAALDNTKKLQEKAFGSRIHEDIASTIHTIGQVYYRLGRYVEALKKYKESLSMYISVFRSKPHPDIASSLHAIGMVYYSQGQYAQALKKYNEALNMRSKLFPTGKHPNIAFSLHDIGVIYSKQGQYNKALINFNEALVIFEDVFRTKVNANIASSLHEIGVVYSKQGQYDEAFKNFNDALIIFEQVFGTKEHANIASCLYEIGIIYARLGQNGKALEKYEECLSIQKKIFEGTHDHPKIKETKNAIEELSEHVKGNKTRSRKTGL